VLRLKKKSVDEERLSDLHFQLASADRRRIVEELLKEDLKLNEVAKRMGITATEAFRQLQRLTDAGLLEKMPDGRYHSTRYAKLILDASASLSFISKNREHFVDHDASLIPPEFRGRLGELINTDLLTETVPNLNRGTEAFKKAEKRIDLMVEQRLEQHNQVIKQRASEGVPVRFLMQDSLLDSVKGELSSAKPSGEVRSVPRICAMVLLIDESMVLGLPRTDGRMDYQLFSSNDPVAVKWGDDLFEDQWKKARPWHP
jgi:predicted transcriptional regulator